MKVFSLNTKIDDEYVNKVWDCIVQNVRYIKKFNGADYEEAMHLILARITSNRNDKYKDLTPYVKKLARTEMRQRTYSKAYNLVDDETGEIARPFLKLTDSFDILTDDRKEKLLNVFRDMYLLYPDDIMLLRTAFEKADISQQESKEINTKVDKHLRTVLWKAIQDFNVSVKDGGRYAYQIILEFYNEIAREQSKQLALEGTKYITLEVGDYRCASRFSTEPTIRIVSDDKNHGLEMGIDTRNGITMTHDVNIDLYQWVPISKTKCDIIKIDISALADYLYENVYVDKGVNTPHCRWAGDRYVLITPGGEEHLNLDPDLFIELCVEELLLNMTANSINNIIGFTPDSVYVRPVRKITYNTLRCKLYNGKNIDLSVSYYKTK